MASYTDITNILNFSASLSRTSAFPLDAKSMFGSKAAADAAALTAENAGSTNTYYYFGMPVIVFENDKATMYIIDGDKTLKEVGAATYGDDKSIVLDATTGTLSLKSFGKEYYKYNAVDVDHENPYYTLVEGWKEGLEPKVIGNEMDGFSIAWYEPSATTVEGLSSSIASLSGSVQTLNGQVSDLDAAVKKNTDSITLLNADASIPNSVKNMINVEVVKIVDGADANFDTLKEISDWIIANGPDATKMNSNIMANATAIDAINTLLGTKLPTGISATTVIEYIAEAVAAETTRATNAEGALSDRIDDLEAINPVESISADGVGNISVDGAEMNVYTLPTASVTEKGGIKVDETSITVVNDVASVKAVDPAKVTGLTDIISTAKDEAVQAAAEDAATKYLVTTDVVAAADVTTDLQNASDTKAASEKLVVSAMSWKTVM